jgi:putative tricarboxylic transport membrane protein
VKQNAGVWGGLFSLVFSLVFLVTSLQYEYSSNLGPGPGLLPLWLSGLMTILSLFYIAESIKYPINFRDILPASPALKKIAVILFSLVLFVIIVDYIGFVISSAIFLFLLFRGEFRWFTCLGLAVGVSILLYWIFIILLNIPLPVNELGW